MKINLKNRSISLKNNKRKTWQIISRTILILVFLFIFFYIAMKLSEQVGVNYLQSHFHISLDTNQTDQKIILPSQKFYSTLELKTETNDNYLDITLSGGDVFMVEFLLDDKSDFILISTIGNEAKNYLYFIPKNITNRGYKKIRISPIRGDGDYWLQSINTYKDPDFNKFPTHVIIDFEIKKIEIEIGEDELAKIEEKRTEALQLGILLSEDEDYVSAVIYADGKKDDIEIRLKGDWAEHLQEKNGLLGSKWMMNFYGECGNSQSNVLKLAMGWQNI